MNLEFIKKEIDSRIGKNVKIICNCSRNKKEYYTGKIIEVYGYIFIVKLDSNKNKSFSYSDIITKNVKLVF